MRAFVFMMILTLSNALLAQALPVKIEKVKGKVLYYRDRAMSQLTERSKLQHNDLIMTQEGRVTLEFEDTSITLSPQSLFRISNTKNTERYEFGEFYMGELLAQTREKLVDKRKLEILLAKAKVQVLGTKYIVQIASNVEMLMARQEGKFDAIPRLELIPEAVSSSDLVTQVTCIEGKVALIPDEGEKQELEANASALYSGNGVNLRLGTKDESEIKALLEGLGFSLETALTSDSNPAE